MTKANQHIETILRNLSALRRRGEALSPREYAVFLDWLSDANGFNASSYLIGKRLGMDDSNVRKTLKRLVQKGLLTPNGKDSEGRQKFVLTERLKTPPEVILEAGGPVFLDEETESFLAQKKGGSIRTTPGSPPTLGGGSQPTPPPGSVPTLLTSEEPQKEPQKKNFAEPKHLSDEEPGDEAVTDTVLVEVRMAMKRSPDSFLGEVESLVEDWVTLHGGAVNLHRLVAGANSRLAKINTPKARKLADAVKQAIEAAYDRGHVAWRAARVTVASPKSTPLPTPQKSYEEVAEANGGRHPDESISALDRYMTMIAVADSMGIDRQVSGWSETPGFPEAVEAALKKHDADRGILPGPEVK